MKRKILSLVSLVALMFSIAFVSGATPVHALDQYPKWGRDNNNIPYNGYYTGGASPTQLWDIYQNPGIGWSKAVVWNDTGSTWVVRLKSIPATSDQVILHSPMQYIVDASSGSSGTCYPAATGGQAWGCQITILDGGSVVVWVNVDYNGDNTPSWYSTTYYMYPDDYSYTIATHTTWVTLH